MISIDCGTLRSLMPAAPGFVSASLRQAGGGENYNVGVARGWESKSVEAQQAEVEHGAKQERVRMSPAQAAAFRQREGLRLSRARLRQQMEAVTSPRRRQMLQDALAELDRKLAEFGEEKSDGTV